jgi:3-methylfumaryl-CoA hydratase
VGQQIPVDRDFSSESRPQVTNPTKRKTNVAQAGSISDWIGRQRKQDDDLSLGQVRRLAAMLDQHPAQYERGSEVPESWYAILFGATARQSALGPDGHPLTGGNDLIPPLHNTRRMFAGRRVAFHKPLRVGDRVERVSTVRRVEAKTGRTGPFTLVTVVHELDAGSGVAVTEEEDLVYREAITRHVAGNAEEQAKALPAVAKPEWSLEWNPDTTEVFRYSALTFNAHRIHYDLTYTREQEGYPALVMNGGLTALKLVEAARPRLPGAIAGYSARALAPLFIGQALALNGRIINGAAETWASDSEGAVYYRVNIAIRQR